MMTINQYELADLLCDEIDRAYVVGTRHALILEWGGGFQCVLNYRGEQLYFVYECSPHIFDYGETIGVNEILDIVLGVKQS